MVRSQRSPAKPSVAVAVQGGGSQAAFAAGVLLGLLSQQNRQRFRLVGLSGSSGGALSAALAWRGLVSSGPDEASQRLEGFWRDLAVQDVGQSVANFWSVSLARLPVMMNLVPYLLASMAEPALRALLGSHLELERLTSDHAARSEPKLFVGSTDVQEGTRVIFQGEGLTYDQLIASAALPPIFRAVQVGERLLWDGLFTTNPPVREFTDLRERPDEIWVVQVNPQHCLREPRNLQDIYDRRNQLTSNLSVGQELYFIQRINQLIQTYPVLRSQYKPIRVAVVEMDADQLDFAAKLDRRRERLEHLLQLGKERCEWFFDSRSDWPRLRTMPDRPVLFPALSTTSAASGFVETPPESRENVRADLVSPSSASDAVSSGTPAGSRN